MPVMGGDEALKGIREISPSVPVVVCSGYNEVEVVRRFTAQRIDNILQKPYTGKRLLEKMLQALGGLTVQQNCGIRAG